jgi:hypothetical protein
LRKEQASQELDEELNGFLEMAAAEKMNQGMSRKDALRVVRLERGSLDVTKEVVRAAGWEFLVETTWQDLRYGLRALRKKPSFAIIALLTLTLGLGINCAIFTVVNAVLLRPLPYPDSERLVLVQRHFPEVTFPVTSATKFLFWREHVRGFETMAGYTFASSGVNLTGVGEPERLHSLRVSVDFFRTLGVQPVLGRGFTAEEDRPGGPNAVVLSHAVWQRRFGGDSEILGRAIRLGGQLWTVVGQFEEHLQDLQLNRSADVRSQKITGGEGHAPDSDSCHQTDAAIACTVSEKAKEEKGQGYWRKRFSEARYKIDIAENERDILQRELGVLLLQYDPNPAKAMRENVTRKEINEHRKAIEDREREITELRVALTDLEDELRHAAGPPGWSRE